MYQVCYPADGHHRPDKHIKINYKGDKISQGDLAFNDEFTTPEKNHKHSCVADQGSNRADQPLDSCNTQISLYILLPKVTELVGLKLFHSIGFYQTYGNES